MRAIDLLVELRACDGARLWVGDRTVTEAWRDCERADWMLWLLAMMIDEPGWPTHQEVVKLAAMCARTALRFEPEGERIIPLAAIEATERWAHNPTEDNRIAAYAACADAFCYARAGTSLASYAAAYASSAIFSNRANNAHDAARTAAEAFSTAVDDCAFLDALRDMANMIRKEVTIP